jgi:mono/diheme cytochrome c family protein
MIARWTVAAALGYFTACNAEEPRTTHTGLPCAVSDLLARRCSNCHGATPQFGAPMPLVTRADLTAMSARTGRRVWQDIATRVHDATRPMPPPPNQALNEDDARILDAWIASGAPESAATCSTRDAGSSVVTTDLLCDRNERLRPTRAYEMPKDVDDALVCYGWDSPYPSKRHIVGLAPAIGATRQLHHVTLLQSDVAVSAVPGACEPSAMAAWRPLYGWAPGAASLALPPEAGLALEPGGHYVVQLHFTNPTHEAVMDASGFDLCSTDQLRANDADVMAFGTTEITVPPHGDLTRDCSVAVPADGATTKIFAVFPHMHRLGRSIRTRVYPGGKGEPVNLGTVSSWDLGNQTWQAADHLLRPGDVVQSECSWRNTTASAVGYGPTADDEMCFSYVMYFPKIQDANWHWSLPALYSICR